MPVSDTTTVLSKLFTAAVAAPAFAFVCTLVALLVVLLVATVGVLAAARAPR